MEFMRPFRLLRFFCVLMLTSWLALGVKADEHALNECARILPMVEAKNRGFAQESFKVFTEFAQPDEFFHYGYFWASVRTNPSRLLKPELMKGILGRSRGYRLEAMSPESQHSEVHETIERIQNILDRFFPVIAGREFPINLRANTFFLSQEKGSFAEFIGRRPYIARLDRDSRAHFERVLTHEALHLSGGADNLLIAGHFGITREAIIEYQTKAVLSLAEKAGIDVRPIYSPDYLNYIEALKAVLIDRLFQGDWTPVHNLYQTGDIRAFTIRVHEAFKTNPQLPDKPPRYLSQPEFDSFLRELRWLSEYGQELLENP